MSQLASSVSRLESQGKLPSQTVINPKQNASAIVLRSGKELKSEVSTKRGHARENRVEDSVARGHAEQGRPETELEIPSEQVDKPNQVSMDVPKVLVTKPPFPERFAKAKKEDEEKEIFETFRKVEVNIPLIDAIKQIPRYAKFLKELCTNKGKLKGNERVSMGKMCRQSSNKNYPQVQRSGCSSASKRIGFPADFFVIDMREDNSPNSTSILLGRPFLKTARTKIDVHNGTLTMEFDGEVIRFNIYESMRYPSDVPTALFLDAIDPLVQEFSTYDSEDQIKMILERNLTSTQVKVLEEFMTLDPNIGESILELQALPPLHFNLAFIDLPRSHTKLLPSILQAPTLELKELPKHLKYAFLGENDTLPVIISSKLSTLEEEIDSCFESSVRLSVGP
ncbi:UNVERIFIED_CONTAM: hypothetical protein Sradi_7071300 [Sesamum radiatum]|uniref:Uncharacterized protein n=1 Tax=Sesamum radiatum TaxID=300843 RepID=A0AAW2J4X8_SESRA